MLFLEDECLVRYEFATYAEAYKAWVNIWVTTIIDGGMVL